MTKFLTPSEVPEEVVCRTIKVPNSLEWLGIFNAVLLAGTYYYNWSDDIPGNMTREEAAEAYRVIFYEYLTASMECASCTLPGGTPIARLNDLGRWEVLDGDTWQPADVPAVPARTEPTEQERRCLAAANAAEVLKQLYEQATDLYNTSVAPVLAAIDLASELAIIIGAWISPLFVAAATIGQLIFQVFYDSLEFITEDLWTEDFDSRVKCALYAAAVDDAGVVTINAQTFIDELAYLVNADFVDTTEVRLWGQIQYLLMFIGTDGLSHAGATTSITEADCEDCAIPWCYEWLDSTGQGDWTFFPDAYWAGGTRGEFTAGWNSTNGGGSVPAYGSEILMRIPFAFPSTLTFIRIEYEKVAGDFNSGVPNDNVLIDGSYYTGAELVGGSANFTGDGLLQWGGAQEIMQYVNIWLKASLTDYNGGYGTIKIKRIVMRGRGDNPVGDNNCV